MRLTVVSVDEDAIKMQLIRNHMGRRDLCKAAGISESNFSQMLRRGTVHIKSAGRIADALGVPVDSIIRPPDGREAI